MPAMRQTPERETPPSRFRGILEENAARHLLLGRKEGGQHRRSSGPHRKSIGPQGVGDGRLAPEQIKPRLPTDVARHARTPTRPHSITSSCVQRVGKPNARLHASSARQRLRVYLKLPFLGWTETDEEETVWPLDNSEISCKCAFHGRGVRSLPSSERVAH